MPEIRLNLFGDASIQLGEEVIGPAAPHLFALLLLLTLAPGDGISRQDIKEFLFGRTDERAAAQRLRQLLYRLRQLGVDLEDTAGGTLRVTNSVVEVGTEAGDFGPLRALPHYHPRLPKAFLAWLDQTRERLEQRTQTHLVREMREAHRRQDWSRTSGLATMALAADPLNEEVAAAGVESKAMLGHRDEALEIADRFVREVEADEPAAASMRRLRARIARTSLVRREGSLRGREECLQLLANQWEQAAEGGGRLCVVLGPAGMGKTRVAETFAAKVRMGGGRVVTYRCDRQASQHPLALFSAVLPELQAMPGSLGVAPENRVPLERLGPSTTTHSGELPGLDEAEARRAELQRALIDLLEAVSAERPMLLVVDDAHLLDEASSDVLRVLSDSDNEAAVLVAGFARQRTDSNTSAMSARRATSYVLPPLTHEQADELLLELRAGRPLTAEQRQWTLLQAQGNPFYVHALSAETTERGSLPSHVRSLATCAYFALSSPARTVLEICLLLETLATLSRVRAISGIDDSTMLSALRELEEADLVRLDAHTLRGPHAILDEALRELVPDSVGALLHSKIAETLAEECTIQGHSMSLAWATVQNWLAAGNPQAAVSLACAAARKAGELGEPQSGVELLDRIPRSQLPFDCHRQLLDDFFVLADASNYHVLVAEILQERMSLAARLQEGPEVEATIQLNIIDVEIHNGGDKRAPIVGLQRILLNSTLTKRTRIEAGKRLIALADLQFDASLATSTFEKVCELRGPEDANNPTFDNAALIYHTVFGDLDRAIQLASADITVADRVTKALAVNACLALRRIGYFDRAMYTAERLFGHLHRIGELSAARVCIAVIVDSAISLGALQSAEGWRERQDHFGFSTRTHPVRDHVGSTSTTFLLYFHNSQYSEAEAALGTYLELGKRNCPRHRAESLAHSIIFKLRCGDSSPLYSEIAELESLYQLGRAQSGMDGCVEALWSRYVADGKASDASALLAEYLSKYRRERGIPEWSLRRTTADDPAWKATPFRAVSMCSLSSDDATMTRP